MLTVSFFKLSSISTEKRKCTQQKKCHALFINKGRNQSKNLLSEQNKVGRIQFKAIDYSNDSVVVVFTFNLCAVLTYYCTCTINILVIHRSFQSPFQNKVDIHTSCVEIYFHSWISCNCKVEGVSVSSSPPANFTS